MVLGPWDWTTGPCRGDPKLLREAQTHPPTQTPPSLPYIRMPQGMKGPKGGLVPPRALGSEKSTYPKAISILGRARGDFRTHLLPPKRRAHTVR